MPIFFKYLQYRAKYLLLLLFFAAVFFAVFALFQISLLAVGYALLICLFFALIGAVLGLTSLADGLSLGTSVLTLAFVLSALAFARALLVGTGSGWEERMPSGAENCENCDSRDYPAE